MAINCRACGTVTRAFLHLGAQPLPNAFVSKEHLSLPTPKYPLQLNFCPGCSLVQLETTVEPETIYDNYLYSSSTSPATCQHFSDLAVHLKKKFGLGYHPTVVDIASNDGILLRAWRDLGVSAFGVEPAKNLCQLAWNDGLGTLNEFFTRKTVGKIGPGSAHMVTAINVFAHVPEIGAFAENVRRLLRPDGVFVVEVQYFRDTVEHLSFDNCYAEHIFYFTLTTLERLLGNAGLRVFDAERVATHGGSLRVYADTGNWYGLGNPSPARIRYEEEQLGLNELATYQEFAKEVERVGQDLVELLWRLRAEGKVIAGYGAPAKATTLLNYCGIGPSTIEYIVDDSPLKQGRYLPGMHIPIVGPERLTEDPPAYIVLLAWNFAQAIMEKTRHTGARYILPLPPRLVQASR